MVKNFIFLGAPGVGKGTMAKLLAERNKMYHISTGDIFREHVKNETKLGLEIKSILSSGGYVPDKLVNEVIQETLDNEKIKNAGFILDGYPRTENQAKFLAKNNYYIHAVVLLEANEQIIMDRLLKRAQKENRPDDTLAVITNRIEVYNQQTAPLIKYYEKQKKIKYVQSEGTIEDIYIRLAKAVL